MSKRLKPSRNMAFGDDVNAYLDTKAETRDASATGNEAIKESKGFKDFIKKRNEKLLKETGYKNDEI